MNSQRIYILSCWQGSQSKSPNKSPWRFRVETVGPQPTQRGFGSLARLLAYLQNEFPDHPALEMGVGDGEKEVAD